MIEEKTILVGQNKINVSKLVKHLEEIFKFVFFIYDEDVKLFNITHQPSIDKELKPISKLSSYFDSKIGSYQIYLKKYEFPEAFYFILTGNGGSWECFSHVWEKCHIIDNMTHIGNLTIEKIIETTSKLFNSNICKNNLEFASLPNNFKHEDAIRSCYCMSDYY